MRRSLIHEPDQSQRDDRHRRHHWPDNESQRRAGLHQLPQLHRRRHRVPVRRDDGEPRCGHPATTQTAGGGTVVASLTATAAGTSYQHPDQLGTGLYATATKAPAARARWAPPSRAALPAATPARIGLSPTERRRQATTVFETRSTRVPRGRSGPARASATPGPRREVPPRRLARAASQRDTPARTRSQAPSGASSAPRSRRLPR